MDVVCPPKVSVSVITYNHEVYIEQAISSILAQQTIFGSEIVVGEDCSCDSTRSILERISSDHPGRMKLLDRPQNLGMIDNAIDTYSHCSGEYVAFLEGDDYWTDPSKLARQVEFMDANPDFSMCFHQSENVTQFGRSLKTFHPVSSRSVLHVGDVICGNPIQTNSILLRRSMLSKIPEFLRELKLGDWPICILLAMKGPIGYIDRPMSAYRAHPHSAWSSKTLAFRNCSVLQMYLSLLVEFPELKPEIQEGILKLLDTETITNSVSYRLGYALTKPLRYLADLLSHHRSSST